MARFNNNRHWIFEHEYETGTVLYRPDVDRTAKHADGQPSKERVPPVVVPQVTWMDFVDGFSDIARA